jgi:hypothetical protein
VPLDKVALATPFNVPSGLTQEIQVIFPELRRLQVIARRGLGVVGLKLTEILPIEI